MEFSCHAEVVMCTYTLQHWAALYPDGSNRYLVVKPELIAMIRTLEAGERLEKQPVILPLVVMCSSVARADLNTRAGAGRSRRIRILNGLA